MQYTPLGAAVISLTEQIEALKQIEAFFAPTRLAVVSTYRPLADKDSEKPVAVPNELIFTLLNAHDRHQDVVTLSKAIVRALDGDNSLLSTINLNPLSPFPRMAEELKRETPSVTDLDQWIKT
jgi:hypothetical protein